MDEKKGGSSIWIPTVLLEAELRREQGLQRRRRRFCITACVILTLSVMFSFMTWLSLLRISGGSMAPTLRHGEIVAAIRRDTYGPGDLIGVYVGQRIYVKRVIALGGQSVDIAADGTVFVDGEELSEPYITEKSIGNCNVDLPCFVPDGQFFILGDHRATSVDSRYAPVGCIAEEEVIGKIVFRLWPLHRLGPIK